MSHIALHNLTYLGHIACLAWDRKERHSDWRLEPWSLVPMLRIADLAACPYHNVLLRMPLSRAVLVLAMPAVAAALMSRTIAPMTSRAAATVRVARPVMLVESVDAVTSVVQSGVVDTLPQMMLADSGELLESITSLSPAAQAVYCASGESNPCVTTTSQFGGSR